jgi:predicted ester cyclase
MSEANKALMQRWFDEVWNKGRADAIEEMFDEYGVAHGLSDDPANPITGPRDFRPFHTLFREAFPNMMIVVEDMIAEGDKVAARCSVRAWNNFDFMTLHKQVGLI